MMRREQSAGMGDGRKQLYRPLLCEGAFNSVKMSDEDSQIRVWNSGKNLWMEMCSPWLKVETDALGIDDVYRMFGEENK